MTHERRRLFEEIFVILGIKFQCVTDFIIDLTELVTVASLPLYRLMDPFLNECY